MDALPMPDWETSAGTGLTPGLSPVVDRPDRRLSLPERLRGLLRRPRFRGSLLRAGVTLLRGHVAGAFADLREWVTPGPRLLSVEYGLSSPDGLASARFVALYVHHAPMPGVSAMVHAQVEHYQALGFAVVFVSMCPGLPRQDCDRLRGACALVVRRRNFGLDFGAWHDLLPLVRTHAPAAEELLLVNDSVCGPFRRLGPALQAMRAGGGGLFGLSENLAPRPHLQSYFLLASGRPAVGDVLAFLRRYRPTGDKRLTIRTGEVALTRWMRCRGHRVAAWCGYEGVERAALDHPVARARVRALYPWCFQAVPVGGPGEAEGMRRGLARRPLNPTHLFWRELVEDFAFPFIKTDLLLRNPLGLSDPLVWHNLLTGDGRIDRAMIEDHLAALADREEATSATGRAVGRALGTGAAAFARAWPGLAGSEYGIAQNGPLVSVIMPVRDRPAALLQAIGSVLRQTWRRLELIVVDDGSADDVGALVRKRFNDPRIRVVRQPPLGVSAARNHGLRLACGELVAYLDSDNLWLPFFLGAIVRAFRRRPDLECAYGVLISAAHHKVGGVVWCPFDRRSLEVRNSIDLNVFVHRRLVYERLGGFDEGLRRLVDWDLILRYTTERPPARVLALGAVYRVLDAARISDAVALAESMACIRAKLARSRVPAGNRSKAESHGRSSVT